MPPYFSIEIQFPYTCVNDSLVQQVHAVLFDNLPFRSGYGNDEHLSADEIADWNGRLLTNRFQLGFTEHYSKGYKQVLLESEVFSEVRMFWSCQEDSIVMTCIIPESDVLLEEDVWMFDPVRMEVLRKICIHIWNNTPAACLQTCLEGDGGPVGMNRLQAGDLPSIDPIAIVPSALAAMQPNLKPTIQIQTIPKAGLLLFDTALLS